jgi:hypothetical protein
MSSYTKPNSSNFTNEKTIYRALKAKAHAGAEWWGNSSGKKEQADFNSNYKVSYCIDKNKDDFVVNHLSRFRRKKTLAKQETQPYNIITGTMLSYSCLGLDATKAPFDPTKTPKRISIDKLRKSEEAKDGRSYNIITNVLTKVSE